MVEVYSEYHLRVQTRGEADTARRPISLGPLEGCRLQVPQN